MVLLHQKTANCAANISGVRILTGQGRLSGLRLVLCQPFLTSLLISKGYAYHWPTRICDIRIVTISASLGIHKVLCIKDILIFNCIFQPVAARSTAASRRAEENLPMDLHQDEPPADVVSICTQLRASYGLSLNHLSQWCPGRDMMVLLEEHNII